MYNILLLYVALYISRESCTIHNNFNHIKTVYIFLESEDMAQINEEDMI